MAKIYAVGWQAGHGEVIGKLKNFREVISDEIDNYIDNIKFSNNINCEKITLLEKFNDSISTLQNVTTNGNNTEVPFYRTVSDDLKSELDRAMLISNQLEQALTKLTNFKDIRLYIITEEIEGVLYRYYLKALRTATLKSRFIATLTQGKIRITDLNKEGKSLPFIISYAEKLENETITQYVFDVQDYEVIFGLNESKMKMAKENYFHFLPHGDEEPIYKISTEYTISVSDEESHKIQEKLKSSRKLVNMLSKYNNEALEYEWEYVKEANDLSEMFSQTPFGIDEDDKKILLTADSLEAFVSVITNAKKLGIAKHEYEDATSDTRRSV